MKKVVKKILIIFAAIILTSVTIYAAKGAGSIIYKTGVTVEDALNDLYGKSYGSASMACKHVTGNSNTVGTKYLCNLGDGVPRIMYVYKVNNESIDFIMDRNINTAGITRDAAVNYFNQGGDGYSLRQSWTNVDSVSLPSGQYIMSLNNCNWNNSSSSIVYLGTCSGSNNAAQTIKFAWLTDFLKECGNNCNINPGNNYANAFWLSEIKSGNNQYGYYFYSSGHINMYQITNNTTAGLRPVLTIAKSKVAE